MEVARSMLVTSRRPGICCLLMNKTLLLVDGSSYLYRAFHALPDLRNAAGEPTGAIYGMINMLRRLRNDQPADYLACVFDAPGPTFRHDLYTDYKANRSEMPADLATQTAAIHDIVRAQGWPVIIVPGIEADDVIGTLARQAAALGWRTIISTGDKDLAQLVDESTVLINTMSNERLDIAGVRAKFGVNPERIIDYLTLVGDSVDNVPGVDKVGPKTAAKWLERYESLDGVVANADNIAGVVGENLRRAREFLPLARQLVTVRTDCDLTDAVASFDALAPVPIDYAQLRTAFERYGFKTWLREVEAAAEAAESSTTVAETPGATPAIAPVGAVASPANQPRPEIHYEVITTWDAFETWRKRWESASLVALDTETTSLSQLDARLIGISFAVAPGHACYVPLSHDYAGVPDQLPLAEVLERLKPWLSDPQRRKVLQNAKYDLQVFTNHELELRGIAHDTMLEAYVLESHLSPGLNAIARRWLGFEGVSYEALCGKGANQIPFSQVSIEQAGHYAAEDADFTLQAHEAMYPRVQADAGLEFIYRLELQTLHVLAQIERAGVLIDPLLLKQQSLFLAQEMQRLETQAYEEAGQPFNLNSPKQLGEILFQVLKLPVIRKTASGAPSTDEDVLSRLADDYPLPRTLLAYRSLSKLKSTYTDKLPRMIHPDSGRVHTNYAQAMVVTGRLSSSEPNLQNIPVKHAEGRRIRDAFVAPHGTRIVSADYSQIELRILAHLSEDPGLLQAFEQGEDVHRATAAEIFGVPREAVNSEQRRSAKVINFGLIYGMSSFGLAQSLNIDRDAAGSYIKRYFERYPGVQSFMNQTRERAREQGYVTTVFGRRLWFPELRQANGARRAGFERAAINAPMQGTAADLIKMAMVAVAAHLKKQKARSRMVMQVHDELVFEVPLDEMEMLTQALPGLMTQVASLRVPLLVEVGEGKSWGQAH